MDRAIWASWYDLADSGREAYLKWAHKSYIPRLLKRPGFLWGAHFKCEVPVGPPGGGRLRHTDDPAVPTGNASTRALSQ